MSSDAQRPKAREDLVAIEIDGELVVLDRRNQGLHHLNASAAAVLRSCDGTATYAEIAGALAATYAVPTARMQRDITPVLERLGEARLLEGADDGCAECGP